MPGRLGTRGPCICKCNECDVEQAALELPRRIKAMISSLRAVHGSSCEMKRVVNNGRVTDAKRKQTRTAMAEAQRPGSPTAQSTNAEDAGMLRAS